MKNKTSINNENDNNANRLLAAVPMWTMVAERGHRYHFATDTFISLCGRDNLFVRDYVELIDGKMRKVGEGRQVFEAIPEDNSCKICLKVVRHGS